MEKNNKISEIIVELFLGIFAFVCIYPLAWMIYSAFKIEGEIYARPLGLPHTLNLDYFYEVWVGTVSTPFYIYIKNSLFVTVASLVFMCIIATMAAYGISRFKFYGLKLVNSFILMSMAIPLQAYFISLYTQIRSMGMPNHLWSLVILYVTTSLPFAIIMLAGYFKTFPKSIEEAAVIDGCNEFKKMIYIVAPMAKSAIATLAIINFAGYWNELLLTMLVITSNTMKTVNLGILAYRSAYSIQMGHSFAALTYAVLPILVFFLIFQKHIIKGITLGSLKG